MKTAKVYLREDRQFINVPITSDNKPIIKDKILEKWQTIIDLCAKIMDIPAGLIMRISDQHMETFLSSQTKGNPYVAKKFDTLGRGLYCETVIGKNQPLLVNNALDSPIWKDNPDVKLNMISYLGYPIKWPDNEFFGTICVLDYKHNDYSELYSQLLLEFRNSIELDLELLQANEELTYLAEIDTLTAVYNRRKIESIIENEFKLSTRSGMAFGLAIFDLDKFKIINDTLGHDVGDTFLKTFATSIKESIRSTDIFGRWGGDEFVLICPHTDLAGISKLIQTLYKTALTPLQNIMPSADFTYGITSFTQEDTNYNQVIKRADMNLYKNKAAKKEKLS